MDGNIEPNSSIKQSSITKPNNKEQLDEVDLLFESGITPKNLEEFGFQNYNDNEFNYLSDLGTGGSGHVQKAVRCTENTRIEVAVKSFYQINKNSIKSILLEKAIWDILDNHPEAKKYFTKCFGIFYKRKTPSNSNEISEIKIIYESGDFNLKEIINVRKRKNSAYTEQEVTHIFFHLSKALQILRELHIYHCDLKPENIVLSKTKNSYLVIDFGISLFLDTAETIKFSETKGGTKKFCSPEKISCLEYLKHILNNGDEGDDRCERNYNPFHEDVYALGICFTHMIEITPHKSYHHWENIIKYMKNQDIEKRIDANQLVNRIKEDFGEIDFNKNTTNFTDIYEIEKLYYDILKEKKYLEQGFEETLLKYSKANKLDDIIDLLKKYLKSVRENRENDTPTLKELTLLMEMGRVYITLGDPEEALKCYEKAKELEKEFENEGNLEVILRNLIQVHFDLDEYDAVQKTLNELWEIQKRKNNLPLMIKCIEFESRFYGNLKRSQLALKKLEIIKEYLQPDDILRKEGIIYHYMGEYKISYQMFTEAYNLERKNYTTQINTSKPWSLAYMANEESSLGLYEESKKKYQEILKIIVTFFKNKNSIHYANVRRYYASVLGKMEEYDEALNVILEVLDIYKRLLKTEFSQDFATAYLIKGILLYHISKYEQALEDFKKALNIKRVISEKQKMVPLDLIPLLWIVKTNIRINQNSQEFKDSIAEHLDTCYAIKVYQLESMTKDHPYVLETDYVIGELLIYSGKMDEANLILQRVLECRKKLLSEFNASHPFITEVQSLLKKLN